MMFWTYRPNTYADEKEHIAHIEQSHCDVAVELMFKVTQSQPL